VSTSERESLKVALLNSSDLGGGAENVARMLRDGLRRHGHETVLWVGRRRGRDDPEHTRALPCTEPQRRIAQRYASRGFFNLGLPSSLSFCDSAALSGFDLIHLHNLHGHYFSIAAVPRLARRLPLVWTLHDYFPITGGCAFPYECQRWMSRCGECPEQGRYPIATEFDRTRRMHSVKRQVFQGLSATLVTPSKHLASAVKRSAMFAAAEMRVIPYGVDTDRFQPGRESARLRLGLPRTGPVVLLVAQGLDDPRKGIKHAVTALQRVGVPGLTVLIVGAGDADGIVDAMSVHTVRPLGYVKDRAELSRCYAAADLFVFTSLAENFPCVVQEAMASGTAVLAFEIDGVNEQITPDQTGFLVPPGDTGALTRAARQLLPSRARLVAVGNAARRYAREEWNLERFIERHEDLYRSILARATPTLTGRRPGGAF
jgi:glycosyltransferase involved in cell wall biosynthesis